MVRLPSSPQGAKLSQDNKTVLLHPTCGSGKLRIRIGCREGREQRKPEASQQQKKKVTTEHMKKEAFICSETKHAVLSIFINICIHLPLL